MDVRSMSGSIFVFCPYVCLYKEENPRYSVFKLIASAHAWWSLTSWKLSFTASIVSQLDKCIKFTAFRGVIFYSVQSFLSP